jgi:enamine deaminase RidA (YjgF/YER057c/UK114 family)
MNTLINPATIGAPAAAYSLGVRSSSGSELLHTSGIVATAADGSIPEDLREQADAIWFSLGEIVTSAGFTLHDVVSYTTYVVDGNDLSVVMAARDAALNGHRAASTLIVVPRLARPEWRMEISAVAAKTGIEKK